MYGSFSPDETKFRSWLEQFFIKLDNQILLAEKLNIFLKRFLLLQKAKRNINFGVLKDRLPISPSETITFAFFGEKNKSISANLWQRYGLISQPMIEIIDIERNSSYMWQIITGLVLMSICVLSFNLKRWPLNRTWWILSTISLDSLRLPIDGGTTLGVILLLFWCSFPNKEQIHTNCKFFVESNALT